jgi:hypothetical protein
MGQSNVSMTAAIANVRSLLDEPNPAFWSNAELGLWLNEGCVDVQRRCEILRQESALPVAASAQNILAPNDVLRIYRLEFVPTGQTTLTYPLEFRGYMGMDQIWGNLQSLPSAWPEYYTLWFSPVGANESGAPTPTQLTIRLFPVPSGAGSLNCFYYRLPVAANVTPGTDTLDIVPGWEDACYDYAMYRALRKDADPRWNEAFQTYMDKLVQLMSRTHPDWTDQPDYFSTGPRGIPSWLSGSDW